MATMTRARKWTIGAVIALGGLAVTMGTIGLEEIRNQANVQRDAAQAVAAISAEEAERRRRDAQFAEELDALRHSLLRIERQMLSESEWGRERAWIRSQFEDVQRRLERMEGLHME